MGKILMFEISAKKGLCYVICGSEVKTSDLAAHFHAILALQIRFCLLFFLNLASRLAEAMAGERGSY